MDALVHEELQIVSMTSGASSDGRRRPECIAPSAAGMAHLFRRNLHAGCNAIKLRHVSVHCWSLLQLTGESGAEPWPRNVRDRIE